MPPGVLRDRGRAMKVAFLKTLKDPEFGVEAKKKLDDLKSDPRDQPA